MFPGRHGGAWHASNQHFIYIVIGRNFPKRSGSEFILALEAGLPILPVIIQGSREIMPKGSYTSLGGTVRVTVCKPIPTSDYTYAERNLLLEKVKGVMADQLVT